MTSISTLASASISAFTSTAVIATAKLPISSRYAAPMARDSRRYSARSVTYHTMRTMCSGVAPSSASTARTLASAWRAWPARSAAGKRCCSSQPIMPATKIVRPRATTPLAYPLGRGQAAGCKVLFMRCALAGSS